MKACMFVLVLGLAVLEGALSYTNHGGGVWPGNRFPQFPRRPSFPTGGGWPRGNKGHRPWVVSKRSAPIEPEHLTALDPEDRKVLRPTRPRLISPACLRCWGMGGTSPGSGTWPGGVVSKRSVRADLVSGKRVAPPAGDFAPTGRGAWTKGNYYWCRICRGGHGTGPLIMS